MQWQTMLKLSLMMIMLAEPAASVIIHQVLYNPVQESGSEAVELYNDQNRTVDISGWRLTTGSYDPDATIPKNTMLEPHQFYLVADKSWGTARDNETWPLADHEEAMTIKNTNSGIMLKNAHGEVMDSVGWGVSEFVRESPAPNAKQGYALLRTRNTGNNSQDFISALPQFAGRHGALVLLDITNSEEVSEVLITEDDSDAPGIQLSPRAGQTRSVIVRAQSAGIPRLQFQNQETSMQDKNGTWEGILSLPHWLAPGMYDVLVSAGGQPITAQFEYLPLTAWAMEPRNVRIDATPGTRVERKFRLMNKGNTPVRLTGSATLLTHQTGTIEPMLTESVFTVIPGKDAEAMLRVQVPADARGTYSGTVVFRNE